MKVLFVCLGNICRSPLAMGILRDKLRRKGLTASVDSAGFEEFHIGNGADPRSVQIAEKHGIDITDHIARLFRTEDFDRFDKIYVMDSINYSDVLDVSRNEADRIKVDYILNLLESGRNQPVPDPYYGGRDGFERTYNLLDKACEKLATIIESNHKQTK